MSTFHLPSFCTAKEWSVLAEGSNNAFPSELAIWERQNSSQDCSLCRSSWWSWAGWCSWGTSADHGLRVAQTRVPRHSAPCHLGTGAMRGDCWMLPSPVWHHLSRADPLLRFGTAAGGALVASCPVPLGIFPAPELVRDGRSLVKETHVWLRGQLEQSVGAISQNSHFWALLNFASCSSSDCHNSLPEFASVRNLYHLFPVAVNAFVSGWWTPRIPSAVGVWVSVPVPQARLWLQRGGSLRHVLPWLSRCVQQQYLQGQAALAVPSISSLTATSVSLYTWFSFGSVVWVPWPGWLLLNEQNTCSRSLKVVGRTTDFFWSVVVLLKAICSLDLAQSELTWFVSIATCYRQRIKE